MEKETTLSLLGKYKIMNNPQEPNNSDLEKVRIRLTLDRYIIDYFKENPFEGSYFKAINWALGNYVMCQKHYAQYTNEKLMTLVSDYSMKIHELLGIDETSWPLDRVRKKRKPWRKPNE